MGFIARFFLLVLFLSIGELYLLVELSMRISVLLTFVLCAFTGIVGGAMVRHQGLRTLSEIGQNLSSGKMPGEQIVSGLILLSIGIMLLTPGFITDTVAFLMLIPPLRYMVARLLTSYFKKRITVNHLNFGGMPGSANMGGGAPFGKTHESPGTPFGNAQESPGGPVGQRPRNEDIVIEVDPENP